MGQRAIVSNIRNNCSLTHIFCIFLRIALKDLRAKFGSVSWTPCRKPQLLNDFGMGFRYSIRVTQTGRELLTGFPGRLLILEYRELRS